MNLTRLNNSGEALPATPRYETLSGLLDAYRTPVAILLFGLIVSLGLFFATLIGQSQAKEREFRNHAGARIAEIDAGFAALSAELGELVNAVETGLAPETVIEIFDVAVDPVWAPPVRDLGLLLDGSSLYAAEAATAAQVRRAIDTRLDRDPVLDAPVVLSLPPARTGQVRFAVIAPLAGDGNRYAYVTSDFDALAQPTELRSDPAWIIARFGRDNPVFALARNVELRDRLSASVTGLSSVLDTAPYALRWSGRPPFETMRIDIVPRRNYLLSVGPLPWIVLLFSLFATGTIGALALKDARHAADIGREVDIKTAELRRSHAIIEAKNEELARFAAHASHDLQAPLRAMKGMSSLLVERQIDLDDRSQQMLKRINRGADRAQRLVQDLLSYTRADTAEASPESIPPAALKSEIEELLAPAIEECGGTLEWRIDTPIEADRFLLTRALQNLISNAVKYRSAKPLRIEVSARTDRHGTTLCVSDNGMGIDPQHFGRIFDVFERLHSVDQYEGSGIGLALCKRVAELHDGRIWVESEPGIGSHFFLHLPRTPEALAAASNDR
ncbi:MAG: ATP-binding protein [Pseudomonadota bacterium]|nr:ATP-binding protein [Pseudomonadota bacterium]